MEHAPRLGASRILVAAQREICCCEVQKMTGDLLLVHGLIDEPLCCYSSATVLLG